MDRATEKLFPIAEKTVHGTKWGYMNRSGRTRISLVYDQTYPFQKNDLALVELNDKQGLLNEYGRFIVKPIYESIQPFSEERAVVQTETGFGLIDETGRMLTKKRYQYIGQMNAMRAVFQDEMNYGYLDEKGQEAIPPIYANTTDFENEGAVVQTKEGQFLLLDHTGKMLYTYPFPSVGQLSEGLMSFKKKVDGKEGYITKTGAIAIDPTFDTAMPFHDGYAVVAQEKNGQYAYGLVNKQGKITITPTYDEVRMLGEGRVALGKLANSFNPFATRFALAKESGEVLTDFKFTNLGPFQKGVASASDGRSTFFIRLSGKRASDLPSFEGTGILEFIDGLIAEHKNNRTRYVKEDGTLIWEEPTEVVLRTPYKIKEELYEPNEAYIVYYPKIEGMSNQVEQQAINLSLAQDAGVRPVTHEELKESTYFSDYEILFFKKHIVVLEQSGYLYPYGAAHGMPSKLYAVIDLRTGHKYVLSELFKENKDYSVVLSKLVKAQIEKDPDQYFIEEYKGVNPQQSFYVDEEALYLVFNVYDIAPYVMGFPTFRIPFQEIEPIIDKNGSFWLSFHRQAVL